MSQTTADGAVVNGVDIDVLGGTVEAINENSDLAKCKFRLRNAWVQARFATLAAVADELPALEQRVGQRLIEEVVRVREQLREEIDEARGVYRFRSAQDLTPGEVVSIVPTDPSHVVRAHRHNAGLVGGVVMDRLEAAGERPQFRVVSQGKVDCRVIGSFQPGDLLVPSEREGYARRGGFYVRPGTLLGKVISGESTSSDAENTAGVIVMLG
jgi:hypothetical protein